MENVELELDSYKVVSEIVESGVEVGWDKAHDISDKPLPDTIKENIVSSVMLNLEKYIKFK